MPHQMSITLTDTEYKALLGAANEKGQPFEALLHEVLDQYVKPLRKSKPDAARIQEYLYREGITEYIPTQEADKPGEENERAYLASLFGQGKPASEIVIEDRGPR